MCLSQLLSVFTITSGAVELPLQCAAVVDDNNMGFNYWETGLAADDARSDLLDKRKKCYDLILHSLSIFEDQCTRNPARQDLEEIRDQAFSLAFSSNDPIFHSHLYDWMVKQGMADALLVVGFLFMPLIESS